MDNDNNFMKNAKDLSRNPLGIIALFISLIFGLAVMLISISVKYLTVQERVPLIFFIILFPVLVLIVFFRLVTNHHWKLYAPKNYRNDHGFYNL